MALELQIGQPITDTFLPTPADIKKFDPRSAYSLLEVVLDDCHHTYKPLRITDDQLAQIEAGYGYVLESPGLRLLIAHDPRAGTDPPRLHCIQNPAAHFQLDEEAFAAGFIVPDKRWREKAGEGNKHSMDGLPKIWFLFPLVGSSTTACL